MELDKRGVESNGVGLFQAPRRKVFQTHGVIFMLSLTQPRHPQGLAWGLPWEAGREGGSCGGPKANILEQGPRPQKADCLAQRERGRQPLGTHELVFPSAQPLRLYPLTCLFSLPLQLVCPILTMAPGEKIKAKIKKNLPVTGPQAPNIKELMQWYCLNTNTHGCRRIVVSRGRLRRLLWILFTLTAVGLIFWQCALLISSFYTVSVSIKVHFQKLDFPAVTICNINPYK